MGTFRSLFFFCCLSFGLAVEVQAKCGPEELAEIYHIYFNSFLIRAFEADRSKDGQPYQYKKLTKTLRGVSNNDVVKDFLDYLHLNDPEGLKSFLKKLNANSMKNNLNHERVVLHARNSILIGQLHQHYFGYNDWQDATKFMISDYQANLKSEDPVKRAQAPEHLELLTAARDNPFDGLLNLIATTSTPE